MGWSELRAPFYANRIIPAICLPADHENCSLGPFHIKYLCCRGPFQNTSQKLLGILQKPSLTKQTAENPPEFKKPVSAKTFQTYRNLPS